MSNLIDGGRGKVCSPFVIVIVAIAVAVAVAVDALTSAAGMVLSYRTFFLSYPLSR